MRLSQLALGLLILAALAVGVVKLRGHHAARAAQHVEAAPAPITEGPAPPPIAPFHSDRPQPTPVVATPVVATPPADADDDVHATIWQSDRPPADAQKSIDGETLEAAVTAVVPELNRCYREALGRDKSLRGDITIEMTVAPQPGEAHPLIEDAAIDAEEFQAPLFEQCMLSAMMALKLPQPSARLYISYPFTLDPGDDDEPDDKDVR